MPPPNPPVALSELQIAEPVPPGLAGPPPGGPKHGRRPWLRSLGLYAITLFVVVTIVFALPRAMPGDPLSALEDPDVGASLSEEVRAKVREQYGLDKPLLDQYGSFLGRVAQGDLGWSIARNAPVSDLIWAHLPWTALLVGGALLLSAAVAFLAGMSAAWRRGRARDRFWTVIMTAVNAVPEYALAAILLVLFAVLLPVFPLAGARTPFRVYDSPLQKVADIAKHLALPLAALTLSLLGTKFLLVRNTVLSALGQDYMVLARAKGLPERLVKYRHAGRNALLPFLTVVGIQAGFAVGGAVFVESVFDYPGMGTLILRAVETRDYPVLEGTFLVLAAVVLVINLLLELVYARVDPRVRAE